MSQGLPWYVYKLTISNFETQIADIRNKPPVFFNEEEPIELNYFNLLDYTEENETTQIAKEVEAFRLKYFPKLRQYHCVPCMQASRLATNSLKKSFEILIFDNAKSLDQHIKIKHPHTVLREGGHGFCSCCGAENTHLARHFEIHGNMKHVINKLPNTFGSSHAGFLYITYMNYMKSISNVQYWNND